MVHHAPPLEAIRSALAQQGLAAEPVDGAPGLHAVVRT